MEAAEPLITKCAIGFTKEEFEEWYSVCAEWLCRIVQNAVVKRHLFFCETVQAIPSSSTFCEMVQHVLVQIRLEHVKEGDYFELKKQLEAALCT